MQPLNCGRGRRKPHPPRRKRRGWIAVAQGGFSAGRMVYRPCLPPLILFSLVPNDSFRCAEYRPLRTVPACAECRLMIRARGRLLVTQRANQPNQFQLLTPMRLVPMPEGHRTRGAWSRGPCRESIHRGNSFSTNRAREGRSSTDANSKGASSIFALSSDLSTICEKVHKSINSG